MTRHLFRLAAVTALMFAGLCTNGPAVLVFAWAATGAAIEAVGRMADTPAARAAE